MNAFELDPVKDGINKRKHLLPLDLGIQVFDRDFIEEQDVRIDYSEARFIA